MVLMRRRLFRQWIVVPVMTGTTAMVPAPTAAADPTADLRSAVAANRGNCPALQQDSILDDVAECADDGTRAYLQKIVQRGAHGHAMANPESGTGRPASSGRMADGNSNYTTANYSRRGDRCCYGLARAEPDDRKEGLRRPCR